MEKLSSFSQLQTPRLREDLCLLGGPGSELPHEAPEDNGLVNECPAHTLKWLVGETERGETWQGRGLRGEGSLRRPQTHADRRQEHAWVRPQASRAD